MEINKGEVGVANSSKVSMPHRSQLAEAILVVLGQAKEGHFPHNCANLKLCIYQTW